MDYLALQNLKANHRSIRFLAADYFPLIAHFFHVTFLRSNRRSIPFGDLVSQLDDLLYSLRRQQGAALYPKSAREYLDDWCDPAAPYLRKYYVHGSDDPECDLLPETERALEWARSLLEEKAFVGTESRLLTVFSLLRELVEQTEHDIDSRVATLEAERAEVDRKIERLKSGVVDRLDATQVKERFYGLEETAQKLLADFRQIEANFRELDRETRELITASDRGKGELLDEIFTGRDVIRDSDQGRSFRAFWEFLMSVPRQEEFDGLLKALYAREEIRELTPAPFLARIKIYLLEAGEKIYRTGNSLTEQLRRFLDERVQLDNRRIMELMKEIERHALDLKNDAPSELGFMHLDGLAPELDLAMGRGLYVPAANPVLNEAVLEVGDSDAPLDSLYQQMYVDERRLLGNIRELLEAREQVSLKEVTVAFPPERGLAEVVAYLNLASRLEGFAVVDDEMRECVEYSASSGEVRRVNAPRVIFVRSL